MQNDGGDLAARASFGTLGAESRRYENYIIVGIWVDVG